MSGKDIKCIDCEWLRDKDEALGGFVPSELFSCIKDGCTKTCGDVHAIRDCSWFDKATSLLFTPCEAPKGQSCQCGQCSKLNKIPYQQARPTHHENWKRSCDGSTCQYEDTAAIRKCLLYLKGVPKDRTNLGY